MDPESDVGLARWTKQRGVRLNLGLAALHVAGSIYLHIAWYHNGTATAYWANFDSTLTLSEIVAFGLMSGLAVAGGSDLLLRLALGWPAEGAMIWAIPAGLYCVTFLMSQGIVATGTALFGIGMLLLLMHIAIQGMVAFSLLCQVTFASKSVSSVSHGLAVLANLSAFTSMVYSLVAHPIWI